VFDLAAALGTGQPFLGHAVKRQCGVLLIAAEGADEVRLRLDAVVRAKCGGMSRAPFRWYETAPMLLHKGSVETLIAMARQADDSLQQEFGLPLGLIVIDTIAACAGYAKTGDENDNAVGQAIMNVLKTVAQTLGCFVLAVDHFGKNLEAGTRGAYSKESAGDLVLACLGEKELSGGAVVSALIKLPSRPLGRPSAAADAVYKRDRATFAEDIQEFRSRLEFAVSARGWGYVLEGEGAVNKDDIDLVEKLINECRKDGVLPLNICALDAKREFSNVERIDDTTPEEEAEAAYDFCKSTAERYLPFSFWDFQDCYLQMTVEKIDIKSLFDPVCAEFSVPLANRGGWSDLNTLGEMMERFAFWERKGKRCNLLDFADHDPAGQLISDTLRSNMRDLSRAVGWSPDNLHIDRFGLSDDTVNKLGLVWINNLITNKGLRLDDRKHPDHFKPYVQEYIARFGVRKVEANALLKRPQAGRNLCRKAILKYVKPRGIQAFEAALEPRRQAVNIAIQRLLRRRRS
jgi:hypothetical protein